MAMSGLRAVQDGRSESSGGRVRFSAEARAGAVAHARKRGSEGVPLADVAEELGVSYQTLRRWLHAGRAVLRPVRIVETEPATTRVIVRLPGGAVIEGLDAAGLAELVRRLA